MRLLNYIAASVLLASPYVRADPASEDDEEKEVLRPCVVKSPRGSYYDLNPIALTRTEDGKDEAKSWRARGYDYGANFTINFCAPVVEDPWPVMGVPHAEAQTTNISAFYEMEGNKYSIGQLNSEPVFRGRKIVLSYENGSWCKPDPPHRNTTRRKSSHFSLLCERDPTAPKASISFVTATVDECAYFFEARSFAFCPTLTTQKQQMGPSAVFGVIGGIALLVYLVGGIVYQRAVMHQRGWKQLPNYSLWAGMAAFVKDVLIICGASSLSCITRRRGYKPAGQNGRINGRPGLADDSNRLMDQFDETWDD